MNNSLKKDKVTILTLIGMALMTVLTVLKAVTQSQIAGAALLITGLAFFFIVEGVSKTPDSESGLSFKRFITDLKKPGVIILILIMIVLTPSEMFLSKVFFGNAYIEHVMGRVNVPDLSQFLLLLFTQIITVVGEEICFRAFFVGKGMKHFPFWPVAIVSAILFAAAHFASGEPAIVAWDLGGIFIDAVLFAVLFRKSGNCLITAIPHFLNNMIGFILVALFFK